MALATLSVVLLMAFFLGRREAIVVLVAVPMTLALTLASSYLFGYTLNRVTLFALIFAIGILVDDAIVVVENIHRHYELGWGPPRLTTIYAVDEVGNPTILATFAVVGALLPLAFVSGLMGPYMRPIPINASAAMIFSLFVAFVVSPWLTFKLFRKYAEEHAGKAGFEGHAETHAGGQAPPLLPEALHAAPDEPARRAGRLVGGVVVLLLLSMSLVYFKVAKVKMLPYDNKSEIQVVVDMPEGTTLEATNAVARDLALEVRKLPEVSDVQVYVGTSAPFNFNGLVRHYFLQVRPPRRRPAGQPPPEGRAQARQPHVRQGRADAPPADRQAPRREPEGHRGPARAARPLHDGRRDLRPRPGEADRPRGPGAEDLRGDPRRRRRRLARRGRGAEGRARRRPREGDARRRHARGRHADPPRRAERRRGGPPARRERPRTRSRSSSASTAPSARASTASSRPPSTAAPGGSSRSASSSP